LIFDLHVHSDLSDGTWSTEQLVTDAAARGLSGFALTDHDETCGIAEARQHAAPLGLEVLAGVEISVSEDDGNRQLHLLALGFDLDDGALCERLEQQRRGRLERGERIVGLLRKAGVVVDLARVLEIAGRGAIGRPHVARALVEVGACSSENQAFAQYLRRGRPAFVAAPGLGSREAIELIHGAGGLAVLAHPPLSIGVDAAGGLDTFVGNLAMLGLDGLEVSHPSHKRQTRKRLRRLARLHDLVTTAGSDFHGSARPGVVLGQEGIDRAALDAVLERRSGS
jgi:predicted metal-dependent phosphoesterase TrpH